MRTMRHISITLEFTFPVVERSRDGAFYAFDNQRIAVKDF
jgi:hypothetical protein